MGLDLHPAITILVALAPAVHVWWRNRRLARLLDDPAFPERLLHERARSRAVFATSLGVLVFTGSHRLAWALPLAVLARMAAAYPFRKTLLGETWSLWSYLSFHLRLVFGAFGFWIFVAALPLLTSLAAPHQWMAAIMLAVVAAGWTAWYSILFSKILGARPVQEPAFVSRFRKLELECRLPHITLEQVEMRGGVLANAVAVPSITRPSVVVTSTLLERFDEDELSSIFAHELAHHEHYNRRAVLRANAVTYLLIAVGAAFSPVTHVLFPNEMTIASLIWVATLVTGLGLRLQHRQKHETESDLRAVALTGNPEALVRALTKLNALAHLPRRWASDFERRATHPSLARRIQAIRGASNAAPPVTLTDAAVFAAVNTAASVTFHGDRLEWQESAAATHQFAYESLSELRLDVGSSKTAKLLAIDANARRWEFAIAEGDVARVQATLDAVDGRLGKPAVAAPASAAFNPTRLVAWLGMVLAIGAGHIAVAIPALLAVFRPKSQLAGAAGAAVLTAAVLGWRDRTVGMFGELQIWVDLMLVLCGLVLLGVAFLNRHYQTEPRGDKLLSVVAIAASVAWTIVAFSGMERIDLYRSLREWPSAPVLTLACAGGMAFAGSRTARVAFLSASALGLLSLFIGSTVFANSFVDDPFVAWAPAITVTRLSAAPLREQSIEFEPSLVWVSPNGTHIALSSEDEHENVTMHAGPIGGTLSELTADQAAFVSDNRLLLLERETRGSILHLVDLDASARELWSRRLPLRATALAVDRASGWWRLLGLDQAGHIASAEGRFDDSVIRNTSWASAGEKGTSARPVAATRGTVLALESRSLFSPLDRISRRTMFLFPHFRVETRLWSLAGREASPFATSLAEVSCPASSVMNEPALCMGFDGTSTRFFSVDPEMQQLVPVASAVGRFHAQSDIARGWLAGWLNGVPVLLHASTAVAMRMPESISGPVYQLAVGETVFAALSWGSDTSTVRIYPKPQISN